MTSSLGDSPNWANLTSSRSALAWWIKSLHFFGVSSTLPANKDQTSFHSFFVESCFKSVPSQPQRPLIFLVPQVSIPIPKLTQKQTAGCGNVSLKVFEGTKHVKTVKIYHSSPDRVEPETHLIPNIQNEPCSFPTVSGKNEWQMIRTDGDDIRTTVDARPATYLSSVS